MLQVRIDELREVHVASDTNVGVGIILGPAARHLEEPHRLRRLDVPERDQRLDRSRKSRPALGMGAETAIWARGYPVPRRPMPT
jgi:hypothetical protein